MFAYFASEKSLRRSSIDEVAHALPLQGAKADAVFTKLNDVDHECQIVPTEKGVYILGNRKDAETICTTLYGQPKYAAQNDNMPTLTNQFAPAAAKFRLGLDFPVAAAAHTRRAPQFGMALNAA